MSTHKHAILLVRRKEFVDLGQVEQLVKLRLLHLRPNRPLDLSSEETPRSTIRILIQF